MFSVRLIRSKDSLPTIKCPMGKSWNRLFRVQEQLVWRNQGDRNGSSSRLELEKASSSHGLNVGAELSTKLMKTDILRILNSFIQHKVVQSLALEHGLDKYTWQEASKSFRKYCVDMESLPVDLHVVLSDIIQGAGNVADMFPYFIRHAKDIFPHIDCLDDLKKIGDLRTPSNWYPKARALNRKIIFHAGPTNSGKTHHALERFTDAESGIYCGPLKLLAAEVFYKCNSQGTACDLITGEERRYAAEKDHPSRHISCTVEMMDPNFICGVAVIDEIQLIRDPGRGWAWTRALLGAPANEVHLCGEEAAIRLVEALCSTTDEIVEIRRYERLTELQLENTALCSLSHVQPGDCIVCFSKTDIFTVSRNLEQQNIDVAVIYGSLPPGTKLAQAAKFNDIHDPCKVLVATDAIGMGLNLHIRRLIFYSLMKPTLNENGERGMDLITVSSALQIAGRAGRYGTQWERGYVTTFKPEDLPTLRHLLSQSPEPITQAGLHPTADQIELYAYHLPKAPLSDLMGIFVSLCTVDDSLYFMCNVDDFKFLADMIEHVPLPLRARYVFCCAPINRKLPFVCTMFLRFARQYCKNEPMTLEWLHSRTDWPMNPPRTLVDLLHLEAVFDVLDLYLWLSYRFPDLFSDADGVRTMQGELDTIIQDSIYHLTKLLKNPDPGTSQSAKDRDSEEGESQSRLHRSGMLPDQTSDDLSTIMQEKKLTKRLIDQGLLTPSMLEELQREWAEDSQKRKVGGRTIRRKFPRKSR